MTTQPRTDRFACDGSDCSCHGKNTIRDICRHCAAEAATPSAGLDVERLAYAIQFVRGDAYPIDSTEAGWVAAEYARLSEGAVPRAEGLDAAIEAIENVLTGMDWLGTGSSWRIANEEQAEAWRQWDVILTALGRPAGSYERIYGPSEKEEPNG